MERSVSGSELLRAYPVEAQVFLELRERLLLVGLVPVNDVVDVGVPHNIAGRVDAEEELLVERQTEKRLQLFALLVDRQVLVERGAVVGRARMRVVGLYE